MYMYTEYLLLEVPSLNNVLVTVHSLKGVFISHVS